jgi:hypothetical protein
MVVTIKFKMKSNLTASLTLLCLVLCGAAFSQNSVPNKISAIKLTAIIGEQYLHKTSIKAFNVDQNNILRPTNGFKITYFATEKKIAIHPVTMKLTSARPSSPGFDVSPVPGGSMYCLCDKAQDDCKITPMVLDNTLTFNCGGFCGCGSFIIYDTSDPVLEYETGGNWFRF